MGPLDLCIALGPLSIYLMMVGRLNLARRPFVATGVRDTIALAIALVGLAVVGPLRLFMPAGGAIFLGAWVWLPLVGLYALCALLAALLMRPRLVVYNVTVEQLRPILEQVASQLDDERRWAGTSLSLPSRGVHLALEYAPTMRNVQLVSVGAAVQDFAGWRQLEVTLRGAVRGLKVEPNPKGLSLLVFGIVMAAMILYSLTEQPQAVAQGIQEFLGN